MLKFYKTLLLNLLFITSCSIVSFEELKIESNLKKNSIYLNEESFEIIFSIFNSSKLTIENDVIKSKFNNRVL